MPDGCKPRCLSRRVWSNTRDLIVGQLVCFIGFHKAIKRQDIKVELVDILLELSDLQPRRRPETCDAGHGCIATRRGLSTKQCHISSMCELFNFMLEQRCSDSKSECCGEKQKPCHWRMQRGSLCEHVPMQEHDPRTWN